MYTAVKNSKLEALLVIGGEKIVTTLFGLLRYSIITAFTGAAGLGVFGLLQSIQAMITTLATNSLGDVGIKHIAAAKEGEAITLVQTLGIGLGVIAGLLTILIIPFWGLFPAQNVGPISIFFILALGAGAGPIMACQIAVLGATGRMRHVALIGVLSTVCSVGATYLSFQIFDQIAVTIAVISTPFISATIGAFILGPQSIPKVLLLWTRRQTVLELLFSQGLLVTIATLCTPLGQFVSRLIMLDALGIDAVGIYFGALLLSQYASLFFVASMKMDFFPKYAAASTVVEKSNLLDGQLRFTVPFAFALLVGLALMIPFALPRLLGPEFTDATPLVLCLIFAEFIRIFCQILNYVLMAEGRTQNILFASLGYNLAFLILCFGIAFFPSLLWIGFSAILANLIYLSAISAFVYLAPQHERITGYPATWGWVFLAIVAMGAFFWGIA